MQVPFLKASWEDLIFVNYEVDPSILVRYLPRGTELDLFQNKAYVSLVAFRFVNNRLFGVVPSFPCSTFEEINLRFYIRRGEKRAVAFIREVVPSNLIALTAQFLYQEPYVALPTACDKAISTQSLRLQYSWGKTLEHTLAVTSELPNRSLISDSFEEFILEHYWGYTAQGDGSTIEYRVRHPKWSYGEIAEYTISDSVKNSYGTDFLEPLSQTPASVFLAHGSDISVSFPRRFFQPLRDEAPKGWVLYDGACGFCSWWIPYWRKAIIRAGFEATPLQTPWVKTKLSIPEDKLTEDIRLLLNDGTLINGADAYIFGMKQVWWSFPLGWILGLPGFRQLLWKLYKVFNRNRFFVSRVCKFKPELK